MIIARFNRIAGIVGMIAAAGLFFFWLVNYVEDAGYSRGVAEAQQNCQHADIQRLTTVLESAAEQTKQAQTVNLELSGLINKQVARDARTTQELRNALTATATERAACRFNADIMQQLEQAYNRATQAATSGLTGAVPNPGETGKQ